MAGENRPPAAGSPMASRREFLKTGGKLAAGTALAGAAIASAALGAEPFQRPAGTMPTRVLGKTGVKVGVLALGSVGATVDFPSDEEAVAFIRTCIDAGINYIDTGPTYGHSDDTLSALRRIGKAVADRRQEVFVATKTGSREADAAMREIETSLKLIGADHLDSVQIHGVRPKERIARWGKEDGVYTLLAKLKEQSYQQKPMDADERKNLQRSMEEISMTLAYPHPRYSGV